MIRTILKRLLLTILFVGALGVIGFLMLPLALNRFVLPPLLEKTGLSTHHAAITGLSPYRINASLELGSGDDPLVSLPRIELRFSPRSLWRREIDELIIDRGEINLFRQGNRLLLAGMSNTDADSPKGQAKVDLFLLPMALERIIFKHCTIFVHGLHTRELGVEFNGQLESEFQHHDEAKLLQSLSGTFEFFNDLHARLSVSASFGEDRHTIEAALEQAVLSLPRKAVPEYLQGLEFSELLANLSVSLEAGSLALLDYRLDGELRDLQYVASTLSLQGAGPQRSVHFSASGGHSSEGHRYLLESIAMQTPLPGVARIAGSASLLDGTLHAEGQLQVKGGAEESLRLNYDANWSSEKAYNLKISGGMSSTQPLLLPRELSISEPTDIDLSMDINRDKERLEANFSITSAPLAISHRDLRLNTSDLRLSGRFENLNGTAHMLLSATVPRVSIIDHATELVDISFELPIDPFFSAHNNLPAGSLKIGSITIEGTDLFALSTAIRQSGPIFTLEGDLLPLFPAGPQLHLAGSANRVGQNAALVWSMPKTSISDEILPTLSRLPIPDDLHFQARFESSGSAAYQEGRLSGSLRAAISDGLLEIDDKNVSLTGINCAISLPELPELVSEPSQHCSIGNIAFSTLKFSDAYLLFRVEDPHNLFIEKSRFSWSGGSLESGSLRLSRQNPDFETTLYASRIRLADLLTQFGFKGTEGEGSVNGRLPVRVSANRLEIDDGFLFSTPGTGGIVSFSETDLLRQGMGAVSEAGYIDYSLMALKDFTYNWAKLSFSSLDEELLITLELDGKPSSALPFSFKNGMIVESAQGEGLQYPIRLDVNFRLPLAELFQLGQTINSIMGKD